MFELILSKLLLSDETEDSLGFEFFGASSSLIVGVQFADSNFSGSIEDSSLIIFGESFNEIFFHFVIIELETEIDVEGSQKDFLFEVVLIVELFSLVSVMEFDFDEAIFGVE